MNMMIPLISWSPTFVDHTLSWTADTGPSLATDRGWVWVWHGQTGCVASELTVAPSSRPSTAAPSSGYTTVPSSRPTAAPSFTPTRAPSSGPSTASPSSSDHTASCSKVICQQAYHHLLPHIVCASLLPTRRPTDSPSRVDLQGFLVIFQHTYTDYLSYD